MRSLRLTSPMMRGSDVAALQSLLSPEYYRAKVDGIYGEQTAAAVGRAKWALGYPKKRCTKAAGATLVAFLKEERKLPRSYKRRQAKRQKKYDLLRLRALAAARKKIGLGEEPNGSNRNWLTKWWYRADVPAPWCAISVSHSYLKAGSKAFKRGRDWAYVPYLEHAARRGSRGLRKVSRPLPGDIVTFNFDGGVADHVGIFERWVTPTTFSCVEGNTDRAGSAEGGEQMIKVRHISLVSMFIRVTR